MNVWACFAVRSAALCRVPVSIEWIDGSGIIVTFAWRIRFRSCETTAAPSILQSSKSFCDVNRELIRNPPSAIFWAWSSGVLKTIMPPKPDLTRSSITVLIEVPGETSLMKSWIVFSFSGDMVKKSCSSIYNFMWFVGIWNRDVFLFVVLC